MRAADIHNPDMKSDFIPLSVPDLRGREGEYLLACVRDNWVSSAGPFVSDFERRIADLAAQPHAVATVNGTAALHLALIAGGVERGDFVVLPDWTFAATANVVYHSGATPILVDISNDGWTLDPELVGEVLGNFDGGRIGAVIAVDALGQPADMDALAEICGRAGVPLIEDAAGAIGAKYKERPCGGLGDAGVFSFNGNKIVTSGGGGMVVTQNKALAAKIRHLSTQARSGPDYLHDQIGFNYRMTNINAAVGLAQLDRLSEILVRKQEIADAYDAALGAHADLAEPPRPSWARGNNWLYSVLCNSQEAASSLVDHMRVRHIEARTFWRSLSTQPPYAVAPTRLSGVAAGISGRVVSLPSSGGLTDADQHRVLDALSTWSGRV